MAKIGKKLTSWDESTMVDNEIQYWSENLSECKEERPNWLNGDGEFDEDKARDDIYQDSDLFSIWYDDLKEYLTEIMIKKNNESYWFAKVQNFGWRSIDGEKYINADCGSKLLNSILPNADCTFNIHNYGSGIAIQNYHHDSPTGNEWYYIMPCAKSTYEKNAT